MVLVATKDADMGGTTKLDLSHPRVQAAMRVTGIQEKDLFLPQPPVRSPRLGAPGALTARAAICDAPGDSQKGPATPGGASTARGETLAKSKELWERKQRQLLRELEASADALDDEDVEAVLHRPPVDLTAAELDFQRKKAKVDKMRARLMAQLKLQAQREIDKSTVQVVAEGEREAEEQRILTYQAKLQEERELKAEKKAQNLAKVQERLKEKSKEVVRKRHEITSKLENSFERADKVLEERHLEEAAKGQELRSHMAKIAERKMTQEQVDLEQKVKRYEDSLAHFEEVEEKLREEREKEMKRFEDIEKRFVDTLENSGKVTKEKERYREGMFDKGLKKFDTAQVARQAVIDKEIEEVKAFREKYLLKWVTNCQGLKQKRRQEVKELRTSLAEGMARTAENRDRYYEDVVVSKVATKGIVQDIVEHNKVRRVRADECARKQTLGKVEREIARADAILDHRQQLQAYRMAVIRDSMLGRTKVEELRRLDPSGGEAAVKRVNEILRQLDMPALPVRGPTKEGEEGQQQ